MKNIAITMSVGLGLLALPAGMAAQQVEAEGGARVETRTQVRGGEHPHAVDEAPRGRSEARAESEASARMLAARRAVEGDEGDEHRRSGSRAEVEAAAAALAAGARPADIERIRDSAPADRSVTVSLRALAGMTARGISSSQAAAAISTQLARGADDAAITRVAVDARSAAHLNGLLLDAAAGTSVGLGGVVGGAGSGLDAGLGLTGALGGHLRF